MGKLFHRCLITSCLEFHIIIRLCQRTAFKLTHEYADNINVGSKVTVATKNAYFGVMVGIMVVLHVIDSNKIGGDE